MKPAVALCLAIAVGAGAAAFSNQEKLFPSAKVTAEDTHALQPLGALDDDEKAEPNAAPEATALTGEVLETVEVSQYTYLRLRTASGETWAAVSKAPVKVGEHVTVVNATRMAQFKSATLKRTFDVIYFGTLGTNGAAPSPDSKGITEPALRAALTPDEDGELPPGHPSIPGSPGTPDAPVSPHGDGNAAPSGGPELDAAALKVTRAKGKNAFTVAELYDRRDQLATTRVRVRGVVTRVTAGVMGKNFFHLRDATSGSGATLRDLVATSAQEPKVNDVATFEGTLGKDVDVGIAAKYPVLLEGCTTVSE